MNKRITPLLTVVILTLMGTGAHLFISLEEIKEDLHYMQENITGKREPDIGLIKGPPTDEGIMCPAVYEPVCGEDGKTYSNDCAARNVRIKHNGECGQQCNETDKPVCGAITMQCVTTPCPGGQKKTFANKCQLRESNAQLIYEGECKNKNLQVQKELDQAQKKRQAQNITSYIAEQRKSCHCPREYTRPMMFKVKNNAVETKEITYVDTKEKVTIKAEILTVNNAFAKIQEAIKNNADKIAVTYDSELGYPTKIMIDRSYQIADEEQHYTLKILK